MTTMTSSFTDRELYDRGAATMVACWEEIARGPDDAALVRCDGVAAAVFPSGAEREFFNNALVERGLEGAARGAAVAALEEVYGEAGIAAFAAWVHESDAGMRAEFERRGYVVSESTRAMGMAIGERAPLPDQPEYGPLEWAEYIRVMEVSDEFFAAVDRSAFEILLGRFEGENVATGMSYEHGGDVGVYNVGTLDHARRHGLGTALTARLVENAAARGCVTATLQSTPMAEGVYAALGFRDLGRFLEYSPRA
jgi:GNAT superfamily N-acetyltransferase